jgi:putative transposase
MTSVRMLLCAVLRTSFQSRIELQLEVLALRQQIHVLERWRRARVRLSRYRAFWLWLSHVWTGWRRALGHRPARDCPRVASPRLPAVLGMEEPWPPHWSSTGISRRPRAHSQHVRRESALGRTPRWTANCSSWGSPQTWRTFLTSHKVQLMAADFFVVPTVTYRLLCVLVLLAHDRRRIVHLAVTAHPTAAWTAQQLREA